MFSLPRSVSVPALDWRRLLVLVLVMATAVIPLQPPSEGKQEARYIYGGDHVALPLHVVIRLMFRWWSRWWNFPLTTLRQVSRYTARFRLLQPRTRWPRKAFQTKHSSLASHKYDKLRWEWGGMANGRGGRWGWREGRTRICLGTNSSGTRPWLIAGARNRMGNTARKVTWPGKPCLDTISKYQLRSCRSKYLQLKQINKAKDYRDDLGEEENGDEMKRTK